MKLVKLNSSLSVSPQINVSDLSEIANAGIATVINNRPDNEEAGQPSNAQLQEAAEQLGLTYIYQPVVGSAMTEEDVHTFAQHLSNAPQPVHAFCRTGTRSSLLWVRNQRHNVDAALTAARIAGYDFDHLRDQLLVK